MGAIEDEKIYGLTIRESATDGSDFSNPAADYRRLFLGEDGQLHVKDAAGAVTDIGGSVADILDVPTAEMDDTLVLAPDGAGALQFRPETGGTLASARYIRSAGDYTTTSDSFVDVDATNLALVITTGAHRVLVGFVGSGYNTSTNAGIVLTVSVDGVDQGSSTYGLVMHKQLGAGSENDNLSFAYLTDVLSAGEHTFKLRYRRSSANSAVISGSAPQMEFYVMEQAG